MICKFSVGASGASGANLLYISRSSATQEREGGVCGFVARNLPQDVTRAETYEELRENLAAYAKVRENEERGRTHYRCILSFEGKVETERVKRMAEEWLRAAFPKARAVIFLCIRISPIRTRTSGSMRVRWTARKSIYRTSSTSSWMSSGTASTADL